MVGGIPKELRDNEEFSKGMEGLSDIFYQMIVTAANEISEEITKEANLSDGLTGMVVKTMVANTCKEAFDKAYVRYISNGG